MIAKLNFQQPLHKSSVSRDPLEIIFIVLNYKLISNIENCFLFILTTINLMHICSIKVLQFSMSEWMNERVNLKVEYKHLILMEIN